VSWYQQRSPRKSLTNEPSDLTIHCCIMIPVLRGWEIF
jgi:hypothetical protein